MLTLSLDYLSFIIYFSFYTLAVLLGIYWKFLSTLHLYTLPLFPAEVSVQWGWRDGKAVNSIGFALQEDTDPTARTHMMAHNCLQLQFQGSNTLRWPPWAPSTQLFHRSDECQTSTHREIIMSLCSISINLFSSFQLHAAS